MSDTEHAIVGFNHMQVTAPRAEEARARAFYGEVLGLPEIPKPVVLQSRGGAWYQCGDLQLHLGLEDDFRPQRKGHPAFLVTNLAAMRARLEAAGAPIGQDVQIPGYERFETRDPFGNRLEFMRRLAEREADPLAEQEVKARVREAFGRVAEAYVTSPTHAKGADLARLLELAAPTPTDRALDVSSGGGHVALALAPHVSRVTASDLTPRMLAAARAFLESRGVTNADFVVADAEHLPFLDASFDLVTVRVAPHHYADASAAVREMARVLRPGGRLIVIDNIAPADPALDALLNEWERRRDPSHVRAYTELEWRRFIAEAGLRLTDIETQRKTYAFAPWAERMRMAPDAQRALEADILAAPEAARAHFEVVEQDGRLVSLTGEAVILRAVR